MVSSTDPNFGKLLGSVSTDLPGPRSRDLSAKLARFEVPTCNTIKRGDIPIIWLAARGANVVDVDENLYVDLTASACVAVAGHSNPEIVSAMAEQASQLMHAHGSIDPGLPRIPLIQKLAELAPGDLSSSHLANTGAEAVETGYKTARLYTDRPGFLAFEGGFHGKLTGAVSLSSKTQYKLDLMPLLPEVYHYPYAYCYRCPYGREYPDCDIYCATYIEERLDNPDSGLPRMAGLIFEPVIGHGGWIVPPPEFVKEIRRITKERGILLLADEIITGFGRTGRWFACDHFDIVPDILIVGKGIASGYPISAMITAPEIADVWESCQHTSTFMGNPVGSAAAMASINYLERHNLVQRSYEIGERMKHALWQMYDEHPLIGDVRGLGSMVGFEVVIDRNTKQPGRQLALQIRDECHKRGVLTTNVGGMYGNVFKLSPPFVITDDQIDFAMQMLDESIGTVAKSL